MKKLLILISCILIIISITLGYNTHLNYLKYLKASNDLENCKQNLNAYKSKLDSLENTKSNDQIKKENEKINKNITGFLNSYYNYDSKNKNKIYDNMKPFVTDYLINKLKPGNLNSQSNVNYSIRIRNIKIYRISDDDNYNTNVLVLADQGLQTNKSNATSTVLIELKLRNINSNWLVDDILQNRILNNTEK